MLFDSSLRKELERGVLGTLLVLVTVVLTMILIRMLGLAAKGNVAVTDVSILMGYTMIGQLPTLLTLALFIAAQPPVPRQRNAGVASQRCSPVADAAPLVANELADFADFAWADFLGSPLGATANGRFAPAF
jgi:hypothetical protein